MPVVIVNEIKFDMKTIVLVITVTLLVIVLWKSTAMGKVFVNSTIKAAEKVAVKTVQKSVVKTAEKVAVKTVQKSVVKTAEKAAVKTAEKAAVKTAEKAAVKTAEKVTIKLGEKGAIKVAKSVAKKIPLIGVAVGLGFGIWRICEDPTSFSSYVKAGMEVTSGVVSVIPGGGTTASIIIDVLLAGHDVKEAMEE